MSHIALGGKQNLKTIVLPDIAGRRRERRKKEGWEEGAERGGRQRDRKEEREEEEVRKKGPVSVKSWKTACLWRESLRHSSMSQEQVCSLY